MKKIITLLICLLMVAGYSYAQEEAPKSVAETQPKPQKEKFKPRFSLGANAILEGGFELSTSKKGGTTKNFGPVVRPGISFDVQLSKHSGLETGLYYRMNYSPGRYVSPVGAPDEEVWQPAYRDNRLLVPIYYKFYSRILNFAVGGDFSFNLDPNAKNSFSAVDMAFVARISKDFTLYKGLYIEPLLQIGVGNICWWGVGVGLKYRF